MLEASPPRSRNNGARMENWLRSQHPAGRDPSGSGLTSHTLPKMPSTLSISSMASADDRSYAHFRPLPSPCSSTTGFISFTSPSKDKDNKTSPTTPSDEETSQNPSPVSTSSKTNAFFSSPFSIAIPRPNSSHDDQKIHTNAQHPDLQSLGRAQSLGMPRRKKGNDPLDDSPSIFSSSMARPSSSGASMTRAVSDSHSTNAAKSISTSNDGSSSPPATSPSVNTSFFSTGVKPTPPPALPPIIHTESKEEHHKGPNPPPPITRSHVPHFPSISRFFPSRFGRRLSDEPTSYEHEDGAHETSAHDGSHHETPTPMHGQLPRSPSRSPERPFDRSFHTLKEEDVDSPDPRRKGTLEIPAISTSPPSAAATHEVTRLEVPSPTHLYHHQASSHHPHPPPHIRRETRHDVVPHPEPVPGSIIGAPDTPLKLIKRLGQGAFSSVWLATDVSGELGLARSISIGRKGGKKFLDRRGSMGRRVVRRRRESQSVARMEKDGKLDGLKPIPDPSTASVHDEEVGGHTPPKITEVDENANDASVLASSSGGSLPKDSLLAKAMMGRMGHEGIAGGKVVAVKMMDRALCDANDRTRISFVREVEVLRHISHPSIVSYVHSMSIPTHHCLIIEHIPGGELFDLINTDEKHKMMTEPLLRRMWSELCRAVAWMHSVNLVHRDIKLENILLTCNPFDPEYASPDGTPSLALLPAPILKLTDFGLSRFIDPVDPWLLTRCGSESYAAPEIVMGTKYDGRQTDAWACGVVLFALATRSLPFDRANTVGGGSGASDAGGSLLSVTSGGGRRSYLMRIAKNEYYWPDETDGAGKKLVTPGLKKVVEKLLVRNPKKRVSIVDLWEEEWMHGEGGLSRPGEGIKISIPEDDKPVVEVDVEKEQGFGDGDAVESVDTEVTEDAVGMLGETDDLANGLLVNGESIDNVARQEIS
ncbi:hypothetical protein FRC02_004485 [Tulasnella sp. 418]|nr:hypothetical protein FRC02_004485 [Tulasnella sp. 418]